MKVITICTQKGGVAKTTTAEALILYLRRHNYKVLAVDLDIQGNMSSFFGSDPNEKKTVFDFIDGTGNPKDCIVDDMLSGGSRLRYLVSFFDNNELTCFRDAINRCKLDYDIVVIDTPPAINRTVLAALMASDYVIVPTEPTIDSLIGIKETLKAVDAIKSTGNPDLTLLGALLIKFKDRYTLHKQFKEAMAKEKIIPLFKTVIRESQAINTAKASHKDFYTKEFTHSKAVGDYREFCKEVISKIGLK